MRSDEMLFDSDFDEMEQLPRKFTANFHSIVVGSKSKTRVSINGMQVGDFIDDNSKENDFYRFHDVFHYTFATMLGWSPCTRAMMKRKRKSDPVIDEFEDGARATITEEAISLIVFNIAKQNFFFDKNTSIGSTVLNQIKQMTYPFEVTVRSKKEWQQAILKGYSLFRDLVKHNGGRIHFNMVERTAIFEV
jgi:MazG C-terminal domain